jgi:hypothetical protein
MATKEMVWLGLLGTGSARVQLSVDCSYSAHSSPWWCDGNCTGDVEEDMQKMSDPIWQCPYLEANSCLARQENSCILWYVKWQQLVTISPPATGTYRDIMPTVFLIEVIVPCRWKQIVLL